MSWQKLISTVLHPIVMPTIGLLLFFLLTNYHIQRQQQLAILGIIFTATYIIPILLLIFLKNFGLIKSYQVSSIKERKIPLVFMISLFYLLGSTLKSLPFIREFSYLFFGTAISMFIIYFLFILKIKSSLHLLSFGSAICFFLLIDSIQNPLLFITIAILFILSGFLAKARLDLKAHSPQEVYLGFFIGFIGQLAAFYLLQ